MTKKEKLRIKIKQEPTKDEKKSAPLAYEVNWNRHIQGMISGSEELLAALKREHPAVLRSLERHHERTKEQGK